MYGIFQALDLVPLYNAARRQILQPTHDSFEIWIPKRVRWLTICQNKSKICRHLTAKSRFMIYSEIVTSLYKTEQY